MMMLYQNLCISSLEGLRVPTKYKPINDIYLGQLDLILNLLACVIIIEKRRSKNKDVFVFVVLQSLNIDIQITIICEL